MNLLGLLQAALSAFNKLFDWLSTERLRRLGRLEAESEAHKDAQEDREQANRIDAAPPVTDAAAILKRLRQPGTGK